MRIGEHRLRLSCALLCGILGSGFCNAAFGTLSSVTIYTGFGAAQKAAETLTGGKES